MSISKSSEINVIVQTFNGKLIKLKMKPTDIVL